MSVFRNYNSNQAGGVNANAFPRVHSIPWQPTQRNVRSNPNIPSQPQRIQPQERGTFFPTSASDGGTLAPSMSSSASVGCGGGGSCASCPSTPLHTNPSATGTASSFPVSAKIRAQPRGVGALRPTPRSNATPITAGPMIRRNFAGSV